MGEGNKRESVVSLVRSVVGYQCGREAGVNWTTGFSMEIDPSTGKISKVEPTKPEWTDSDLQRDALHLENEPKVGDQAPAGWEEWRKE
jgi:hypothetical protein